jgi:hypothetical protein
MPLFSTWSAVIPLIYLVAGGALAFGANYYFDWRRRDDARRDENRRYFRELRPAARLALAEPTEVDLMIRRALDRSTLWTADKHLPTRAWSEHRAVLAGFSNQTNG